MAPISKNDQNSIPENRDGLHRRHAALEIVLLPKKPTREFALVSMPTHAYHGSAVKAKPQNATNQRESK